MSVWRDHCTASSNDTIISLQLDGGLERGVPKLWSCGLVDWEMQRSIMTQVGLCMILFSLDFCPTLHLPSTSSSPIQAYSFCRLSWPKVIVFRDIQTLICPHY